MSEDQTCLLCGEEVGFYGDDYEDGEIECSNVDCSLWAKNFTQSDFRTLLSQIARIKQEAKQEFIDLICPEHGKTSCNDNLLSNVSECNRCNLLELLREGIIRDYSIWLMIEKKELSDDDDRETIWKIIKQRSRGREEKSGEQK